MCDEQNFTTYVVATLSNRSKISDLGWITGGHRISSLLVVKRHIPMKVGEKYWRQGNSAGTNTGFNAGVPLTIF